MDDAILKAFLSLSACVAVIWAIFFALKKYSRKSGLAAGQNLQIISKITVQPKNHLFMIKAEDRTLLIGVSEKNINLIADLTKEEIIDNSYDDSVIDTVVNSRSNNALLNKLYADTPGIKPKTTKKDIEPNVEADSKDLSFKNFLKASFKLKN